MEDLKRNTEAVAFERTGEKTFTVEHDDGSKFQGNMARFPDKLAHGKVKPPGTGRVFCGGMNFDKDGMVIR